MKTAVLVIDVQQGLCVGPQAAHDCAGTIERINSVTRRARAAGSPVIFVQHESRTGYLEHGSPEWQLAGSLHVEAADLHVRKSTPDSFLGTNLHALLQERGIHRGPGPCWQASLKFQRPDSFAERRQVRMSKLRRHG
jgi:nicotinamidase-related amidase